MMQMLLSAATSGGGTSSSRSSGTGTGTTTDTSDLIMIRGKPTYGIKSSNPHYDEVYIYSNDGTKTTSLPLSQWSNLWVEGKLEEVETANGIKYFWKED